MTAGGHEAGFHGEYTRRKLQYLFSGFPDGRPGVALLLLRAAPGTALLIQAELYLRRPDPDPLMWVVSLWAVVAGALLILGLLTPVAGAMAELGVLGFALSLLPASNPGMFGSKASAIFVVTILLAVILLGPGTYSIDARVFGRREIIIPPRYLKPGDD